MPRFLTIDDFEFQNRVTLVRVDFNSPVDPETKKILEDVRIRAHGETTIRELVHKGAKVVVLAHQGRPGDPDFISMEQHAKILGEILGRARQDCFCQVAGAFGGRTCQRRLCSSSSGPCLNCGFPSCVAKRCRAHYGKGT
jgi:3-phosphoglycerate kinase